MNEQFSLDNKDPIHLVPIYQSKYSNDNHWCRKALLQHLCYGSSQVVSYNAQCWQLGKLVLEGREVSEAEEVQPNSIQQIDQLLESQMIHESMFIPTHSKKVKVEHQTTKERLTSIDSEPTSLAGAHLHYLLRHLPLLHGTQLGKQ